MIDVLFSFVSESSSTRENEVSEGNILYQYSDSAATFVQGSNRDIEKTLSYYAEFPIHTLVLSTNSEFFRKMFGATGMKEDREHTITVKVQHGEGTFLEKMVEAFYNPNVLNDMSCFDLISLLYIGSRFVCITFLGYCINILCKAVVNTVEEYDSVLVKLSGLIIYDESILSKLSDFTSQCLKNVSEMLYPLEYKVDKFDDFMKLDSVTIMHLVKENYAVTVKESHFFMFVYKWLLYEESRQTSANISKFLLGIRIGSLESSFICHNFLLDDKIFNNWEGYTKWFVSLMKKKLLSAEKKISGNQTEAEPPRIKPADEFYRFVRLFSYQEGVFKDKSCSPVVWKGLFILPTMLLKEDSNSQYSLELSFYGENVVDASVEETTIIACPIFFTVQIGSSASIVSDELSLPSGEFIYIRHNTDKYRKGMLIFDDTNFCNFGVVANINEKFLLEAKGKGVMLLIYMQKSKNALWKDYNKILDAKNNPLKGDVFFKSA